MVAGVIVRDLGEGVDDGRDLVEPLLRHAHRRQHEGTAEPLGVEHRPEAGEDAVLEETFESFDELLLAQPELVRHLGERPLGDRDAVLKAVDDVAVDGGDHETPLSPSRSRP